MTARPVSALTSLEKIANWDGESQDVEQTLVAALTADDYPERIKDLRRPGIDPLSYINNLDKVNSHSTPEHYPRFMTVW